jgi:hypothetical protein
MRFIVTATDGRTGPISVKEATAKTAVLKAIELVGQGMSNVVLTDLEGRSYRHDEFHLLLDNRGKFDAPRL